MNSRLVPLGAGVRAFVTVDQVTDCWLWPGAVDARGVPQCRERPSGRPVPAAVWRATGRQLLPEEQLRRTCRNSRCVNPAHFRAMRRGG